ncbi:MAG TPA: LysR family transcriptional regulator [Streptosporangiaceae bacterium]|nr:LysR family transcriptional regulator [Streptosporangiaceae bacterium]
MELDHVQAFLEIVRSGGFARASAELHLSQPAISRRIQLLERELGAPLFDRQGRGAALTDAGRAFLPHARALLASMQDGMEAVTAIRDGDHGVVTLALVGTLASSRLAARLRAHRDAHPGLDLRLRTALSTEVSALVLRGEAGLGLRYRTDPDPALTSVVIDEERLVPVCPPGHPSERAGPAALAGERWLTFPYQPDNPAEPYAAAVRQALAAGGLGTAEIVPVDSLTAQKRMVEAGFGLAVLPESSLDEELRAGTLRPIPAPGMSATIPVVLIRRRHAFTSGAVRALVDALTAYRAWQPGR